MSQYRNLKDENINQSLKDQAEANKKELQLVKENEVEFSDDAFKEAGHVRDVYIALQREYNESILPRFAHLTKADAQFPPYWDDENNRPYELPLHQHNVSTGRFQNAISQLALSYNALFPNQSHSNRLIEVKLLKEGEITPQEQSNPNKSTTDKLIQAAAPDKKEQSQLLNRASYIEEAFDNLIKLPAWARKEHIKMVNYALVYGFGMYFFPKSKHYKYNHLDIRKVKFPSGSTTDPDDWEYLFIEKDISFNELIKQYENPKSGWKKEGLHELLCNIINNTVVTDGQNPNDRNPVTSADQVKEGLKNLNYGKVTPARIDLVSCYWKSKNGQINVSTFVPPFSSGGTWDKFVFQKDNVYDKFSDAFSIYPTDETKSEIRMLRGWGEKIHPLCIAYDRAFCKFLDHLDFSATLFLNINPNDLHKKILYAGTINIGEIEGVQNFPSALKQIVESLIYLDSLIDRLTFTKGQNKTEMTGEGRGGDLATILLTVEGRIQKHLRSRFNDRQTEHFKKVITKVLKISNKKLSRTLTYPEVGANFYDYLLNRGIPKETLQFDDLSGLHDDLPSDWQVAARRDDSSGITNSLPHALEILNPYLSSLPESGFKLILARIISEAFGDEDLVHRIFPDADIQKITAEADLQMAELQSAVLTQHTSDFDAELETSEDIDPRMADIHKFMTLPPTRENDNIIFLQVLLGRVDDAIERFNKGEFGRPTLHIWLYNLVSTAQGHVDYLRTDAIRSKRGEAQALFQRFGQAFNFLRLTESQAQAEINKKLEDLTEKVAQEEQDDPKRMEATAKLLEARAKVAEVSAKYSTKNFDTLLKADENRRLNVSHAVDLRVKQAAILKTRQEARTQSLAGRPKNNEQDRNA